MNNRPDRKAELLAETFHGDWMGGRAGDFARAAARHGRRRRQLHRAVTVLAASAAVFAAGFVALHHSTSPSAAVAAPRVSVPTATPPAIPARGYEIISDDELLAQLRDRPVLVVRKQDGRREIVVLENE
jgi:hypothetical protein